MNQFSVLPRIVSAIIAAALALCGEEMTAATPCESAGLSLPPGFTALPVQSCRRTSWAS